jgi:hypothetical protein
VRTGRQTVRQTDMTKIIVAFRNFAKASKNRCTYMLSWTSLCNLSHVVLRQSISCMFNSGLSGVCSVYTPMLSARRYVSGTCYDIHTYIHTYVLTYVHTYLHTYIHTYIHYTLSLTLMLLCLVDIAVPTPSWAVAHISLLNLVAQ